MPIFAFKNLRDTFNMDYTVFAILKERTILTYLRLMNEVLSLNREYPHAFSIDFDDEQVLSIFEDESVEGGIPDIYEKIPEGSWKLLSREEEEVFQEENYLFNWATDALGRDRTVAVITYDSIWWEFGGRGTGYSAIETPILMREQLERSLSPGVEDWPPEFWPLLHAASIVINRGCGAVVDLLPSEIKQIGSQKILSIVFQHCPDNYWNWGIQELNASGLEVNIQQVDVNRLIISDEDNSTAIHIERLN